MASTGAARIVPLASDPLFVGVTRPAMRWGVTYTALLLNLVVTMEVFLASGNLLTLLLCLPVHGLAALLCARDPRFFDLLFLWARTRAPGLLASGSYFRASSYGALENGTRRQRTAAPCLRLPAGDAPC